LKKINIDERKSYTILGDKMKLIINYPTTKEGITTLNNAIAKIQKELIIKSLNDLHIDANSRKKVLNFIIKELKN